MGGLGRGPRHNHADPTPPALLLKQPHDTLPRSAGTSFLLTFSWTHALFASGRSKYTFVLKGLKFAPFMGNPFRKSETYITREEASTEGSRTTVDGKAVELAWPGQRGQTVEREWLGIRSKDCYPIMVVSTRPSLADAHGSST